MQLCRTKSRKSFILSTKKWIKCFPEKNPVNTRGKSRDITCSVRAAEVPTFADGMDVDGPAGGTLGGWEIREDRGGASSPRGFSDVSAESGTLGRLLRYRRRFGRTILCGIVQPSKVNTLRCSNRRRCSRAILSAISWHPSAVQAVTSCSELTNLSKSIRESVTACCPRRRASLAIDSQQLFLMSAMLGIDSLPLTAVCNLLGLYAQSESPRWLRLSASR